MGERGLVALLKELPSLIGVCVFYKHFTATRFFSDRLLACFDHFVDAIPWLTPAAVY